MFSDYPKIFVHSQNLDAIPESLRKLGNSPVYLPLVRYWSKIEVNENLGSKKTLNQSGSILDLDENSLLKK